MRKPAPSLSTRTKDFTPRELPLPTPERPLPVKIPKRRSADRIKEALLRWLEGEM